MEYRREIDGLRALAVIPVIFFHAGFQVFEGGFVGVDVFFVISGYLITSIIIAELETGTFSLANFYERRARRILPALFFVTAVCLLFAWYWLLPADLKDFSQSLVAVSLFSSNILFWREVGYFDVAVELKPLIHTWSLAVEEQFYVFFPLFLIGFWRFGKRRIIFVLLFAFLASLALAHTWAYNKQAANFFLPPTRAWELLTGALIAFYLSKNAKPYFNNYLMQIFSITGLFMVLISVFAFDRNTPFPSLYALVPTLGAGLLILFATPLTIPGKLLGSKILVGLGLLSYSAYLWHQPIFAFARHISLDGVSSILSLMLIILTILLAYFSWRYVEKPFRDMHVVTRRTLFKYSILATCMFIFIGLLGITTDGFESRMAGNYYSEIQRVIVSKHGQQKCWNQLSVNPKISNACQFGRADGVREIALFGDSHSGSLVSAFENISKRYQIKGNNYTLIRCPSLQLSIEKNLDATARICADFKSDLFNNLDSKEVPETLILLSRWTIMLENHPFNNAECGIESGPDSFWINKHTNTLGYRPALKMDYVKSIKTLINSGRTIVLVYPVPEMGWNVPNRLLRIYNKNHKVSITDGSTSHELFTKRNKDAYAALDALGNHPKLFRIYPEKIFCNTYLKGRCVAHLNGVPLYYDDDHLSEFGANFIARDVARVLQWSKFSESEARDSMSYSVKQRKLTNLPNIPVINSGNILMNPVVFVRR